MTSRVPIDLNVRVEHGYTYAWIRDVDGPSPQQGDQVEVYEPESGLTGFAIVARVDADRALVFLDVDWGSLDFPLDVDHAAHAYADSLSLSCVMGAAALPDMQLWRMIDPQADRPQFIREASSGGSAYDASSSMKLVGSAA